MKTLPCLVLALATAAALAAPPRDLPDFGIILTDDGALSFTDLDPDQSRENLRRMIGSLEGTPVRTLVYEVAAGSQVMFYPTRVGSVWGWRETDGEKEGSWVTRMPINRAAAQHGLDAVRDAGEKAKALGLYFMPGYRVNDGHFAHDPMQNVLTGKFWVDHHEQLMLGASPIPGFDDYQHLFDFSHEQVREFSLAVISEIIDRYGDIMDGLQLDFMRHPIFFPQGTAAQRAHLMTGLLADVRRKLDEAGEKHGRFLPLSVRVPASPQVCAVAGLEVERWVADGLVHVIVPAPAITLSHDLPADAFAAMDPSHHVKVYPSVFPRTQFHWPFVESPTPADYEGISHRDVTEAQMRGAAVNYLGMGAAGFEMYNFNLPPTAHFAQEAFRALAEPHAGDRIYAVTPSYFAQREGMFEYPKQVPAPLSTAEPATFTLHVGEDLSQQRFDSDTWAALRIGLNALKTDRARVEIAVNGRPLYEGPIADIATAVSGRESRPSRHHPPRVTTYLQVPLTDGRAFRQGPNTLTLRLTGHDAGPRLQVVEVQVGIFQKRS